MKTFISKGRKELLTTHTPILGVTIHNYLFFFLRNYDRKVRPVIESHEALRVGGKYRLLSFTLVRISIIVEAWPISFSVTLSSV